MAGQVRTEQRDVGAIAILEDGVGGRAEIWPALGFNCYRWQVQGRELLHADPQLFHGGSPTRSGIPILFPFPNRIRDGRYHWNGKDYALPLNDPAAKNAIHGFACRRPWRIVGQGMTEQSAWIMGEFRGSIDAPDAAALWPADYQILVTYRLSRGRLRIETLVENPDSTALPFGVGFHPYFQLPEEGGDYRVQAPAQSSWVLQDALPTGERQRVDAARDLSEPRPCRGLKMDDILTHLVEDAPRTVEGLARRGVLESASGSTLQLLTSPSFRELVVFTPPHGRAICLEPYTCTTDAINLQARGLDAGLLILPPGERWSAVVELATE